MSFRAQTPQRRAEIVVVTPGFTSPEGGAARVVSELIAIISRRSPFHFTWAAHAEVPRSGRKPDEAVVSGLPVPNPTHQAVLPHTLLPMEGWRLVEKTLGIRWPFWNRRSNRLLRQAIFKADLVWIHDTLYPGARAALRLARKLGRPVLITQHESPVFYVAHGSNPVRRLWARLTDKLLTVPMLRQAQQATFTSNAAIRFYQRRISAAAPAIVIPNGVDAQVFHPPSADDYRNMRKRFALRDDQPVLLFVGRFDNRGGLDVIRRMAELLPAWRFWLAGHGHIRPESWYLPNVQVFRDRSGVALAELYQAADLLILPGYDPESPHVLQQALACQLPVMCSRPVVDGYSSAARCLVVNIDAASPENTAKHWVEKLKAGKDVWPNPSEAATPFDSSWDWLQVAAHYAEILQTLCQPQAKTSPSPTRRDPAVKNLSQTAR